MTLSALIRQRGIATATLATPATHSQSKPGTVATVATVAVANRLLAEEETPDTFAIEAGPEGRRMVRTADVLGFADECDAGDLLTPAVLVAFAVVLADDGLVETWTEAPATLPVPVTAETRDALLARYGPTVQVFASLDEAREVRLTELLGCTDEPTAARLAGDVAALLDLARRLVEQGRIRPVVYRRVIPAPSGVRCIDCRHHRRTDHAHLVDCAAGVEPTNPLRLWWDTDRRGCGAFESATYPESTP